VKEDKKKIKQAVALRYKDGEDKAPKVAAKGQGVIAEKIIALAREAGVPVKEDSDLVEVLSKLEVDEHIPPETYVVVAEILAWVYRVNKKS